MRAERIAELLAPFLREGHQQLEAENLEKVATYIDILLRWNARINLTAIRDPEEMVTRHFGESFFLADHLFPCARHDRKDNINSAVPASQPNEDHPCHLADLGSGPGFPGIPIKIWAPQVFVTLIESNHKKATFLREIVRGLGLTRVNVENVRGETLSSASFDVVTFRAVERFKEALTIGTRLVRPSGRIALLISSSQASEACSRYANFAWSPTEPIPGSKERVVLIGIREPET
jgi:16S rRNA (guanine527-N7)-methyltransferase